METLTDLLSRPALADPHRAALFGLAKRPLSRFELLRQVERVARSLAAAGVRPGDRIAISLQDGPEMATAFLAIGAVTATAPLNPHYREEEFAFALEDLEARALVLPSGDDGAARRAAKRQSVPVLDLTADPETAGIFRLSSPDSAGETLPPTAPDDVALLLHTSGTTSRPKLVPLTHANLCASARRIARTLHLTQDDRCLNVMPLFHVHGLIAALLASLSAGASVVCTPGFQAPQFFDWLDEFRPTWYTAVPTMHQAILARAQGNGAVLERRRLRFLRSSSAPLPPRVFAELERVFRAPVIEAYGMTEASHQMASNPLPPGVRKPGTVGLPAGSEIAVLGDDGKPLGPDETGHVVVRGPSLTKGYVNNPAANQEAFTNGWLRTGDQGRLDRDGYLTLTGRLKEIINRAGEKISPREIDEVLLDHPAVAQAVTFPLPHAQLGEDVAAAVVLRDDHSATAAELREFVANRVADFKVPRRIQIVPEIPKGPTGKLQRIGLAERLGLRHEPIARAALDPPAPGTPLENALVRIWAEVLRVDRIGVGDDFFALGGDSVLAAQVVARIRSRLGVELPLVALFDTPTVSAMAERIGSGPRGSARSSGSIPRRQGDAPPRLSFAQEGLWFLEHLDQGTTAYNRSTNVRIRGPLDRGALERALGRILRRHEVLRSAYPWNDGIPVARVSESVEMPFAFHDLGHLPSAERETEVVRLAREELERPLDLGRAPLIRGSLLRLDEADHVLLLTVHHIVFDRWSEPVLLREIGLLHEAFSLGKPDPLPELPIQYGDFAEWQRGRLEADALDALLSYWTDRLADASPLELPTDHSGENGAPDRFGLHAAHLSEQLRSSLAALSRTENASLFMCLLAAFQSLLSTRTGQRDVVVVSDSADREWIETEPLIGFFVNLLVFRTDLSGNPTFRELIGRMREVALGAYRHRELPFSKLVENIRPVRFSARAPLARALLVLNLPLHPFDRGGTRFEPMDPGEDAARFDLALLIDPKDQGLAMRWRYDSNLFEAGTIAALAREYEGLLGRVVANPEIRLASLQAALRNG